MAALRLRLDAGARADPVAPAHLLSRKGLIEAACQMRDVANDVDGEGEAALRAKEILDRLYLQECFIDEALWYDLNEKLQIRSARSTSP